MSRALKVLLWPTLPFVLVACQPAKAPVSAVPAPVKGSKPSRVAVKHGLDAGASRINMTARDITIEELMKLQRPAGLADDISSADFQDKRIEPLENQVWRLKAHVKSIIKRRDGDYFLTLESPSGATTVVEVPDPELCKGSPLEKEIAASRADLEARFHPTDKAKGVNQDATIEGVGFWGQKGRPGSSSQSNGARLMPGTNFKFQSK
ncbi:MAG: hypothetical protein JSS66_12800 [Armatimonadetes bacterium]|nr:hypothetical protein [Armatimonadota bacterium]